ncbi:hypothetical protein JXJ21_02530 [candidate division KSB1 bacterium]|nr:hypothetical protein [candidate division KSB1 bacterium]
MLNYFNLNERAQQGFRQTEQKIYKKGENQQPKPVKRSGAPADATHDARRGDDAAKTVKVPLASIRMSTLHQVLMYVGVLFGILASSFVRNFPEIEKAFSDFNLGKLVVSCVIALIIIPLIYQKLNVNPRAPFIVQFGLFVQNGVFWDVLLNVGHISPS